MTKRERDLTFGDNGYRFGNKNDKPGDIYETLYWKSHYGLKSLK